MMLLTKRHNGDSGRGEEEGGGRERDLCVQILALRCGEYKTARYWYLRCLQCSVLSLLQVGKGGRGGKQVEGDRDVRWSEGWVDCAG